MAQLTFTDPVIGQEGAFASIADRQETSKVANGPVAVARVVVQDVLEADCRVPTVVADDVDGIMLSLATLGTAAGTAYALADFDGALGGRLNPPRNVTMTFAAEADWDATTAVVTGIDENGALVSEDFATIADAGGVTTGAVLFREIHTITIPAQTGDAVGSVGVGTLVGKVQALGISRLDQFRPAGELDYADNDMVLIAEKGEIFVSTVAACSAGDAVFVLVTGSDPGALTSLPGGTATAPEAAPLDNAVFTTDALAGELARVKLDR